MSVRFLLVLTLVASLQAAAPEAQNRVQTQPVIQLPTGGVCAVDRVIVQLSERVQANRSTGAVSLAQLPELQSLASATATGFRPLIARDEIDWLSRDAGLDRFYILETAPDADILAMLDELGALSSVENAWPDYQRHALTTPNDSYYSQQWAHHNTGQAHSYPYGSYVGTTDCDIDTDQAWDISTGSTGVTIAILDTGIDLDHPDLSAKIVSGYDFANNDSNADDDEGHGTACAGIAAAISNNNQGVTGVDWNARLMPVKVLDDEGSGWDSDIISGITWARTHGADVISMSLGADGGSSSYNSCLSACWSAGVMVVAAAGNDNDASVDSPANNTYALAIGALSPCNERKNPSSCDGEYWWGSSYGTGLEVMAPGTRLHTTQMGGGYMSDMNGTSGATPHVAGILGLLKSVAPTATSSELRQILRDTADDLNTTGWDSQTGYGRVNAYQALLAAGDPCDSDVTDPTVTHTALSNSYDDSLPYLVQAQVSDDCDISDVELSYQTSANPTWQYITMVLSGGYYSATIPAQSYGTIVNYCITATDDSPQYNETVECHTFYVIDPCASDYNGPLVGHTPPADTYQQDGIYMLTFVASDPCGISQVQFSYQFNGGPPQDITPYYSGGTYFVPVPGTGAPGIVDYMITVIDDSPNLNPSVIPGVFHVLDPCQIDSEAPVITHTPPADTYEDGPYYLSFSFDDPCGIGLVFAEYQINGGPLMPFDLIDQGDGSWLGEIPTLGIGEYLYHVVVEDASPQQNPAEGNYSFNVLDPCLIDDTPPTLSHTPPVDTYLHGPYSLSFEVEDPCGLSAAELQWRLGTGSWQSATLTAVAGGYTAELPYAGTGVVSYEASFTDASPQQNEVDGDWSFEVLAPTVPGLQITLVDADTVQLDWSDETGADSYSVYTAGADGAWILLQSGITDTMQQVSVSDDTVMLFRVVANFNH